MAVFSLGRKSRTILLAVVLCFVWVIWSGHIDPKKDYIIITGGLFSIGITTYLSYQLQIVDDEGQPIHRGLPIYLLWLLKEIVLANIDVIKRILTFGPIEESISLTWIKVPAKQQSRLGRVLFANSITLTPGTISVLIEDDEEEKEPYILVNGISKEGAESLQDGGEMGTRVCKAEG